MARRTRDTLSPEPSRMSAAQRRNIREREVELSQRGNMPRTGTRSGTGDAEEEERAEASEEDEDEEEDQQPRSSRRRRLNDGSAAEVLAADSQPVRGKTNGISTNGNGNGRSVNGHRKGKQRAVSSDVEEDDDAEMAYDTQRTRNATASTSNSNPTGTRAGTNGTGEDAQDEAEEEEEAEDTDWEGLTMETYVEKGVTGTQWAVAKLESLTRNLASLQNTYETGLDRVKETAMALEECRGDAGDVGGEGEDDGEERGKEQLANELDARAKAAIDGLVRVQIMEAEFKAVNARLQAGEELLDMWNLYKFAVADKYDEYVAKSERAKYKSSELYKDFKTAVWNVNSEVGCPPISDFLKKADGEESDDDEIEVGGQTQQLKCPITMLPLVDAHTSTKCPHTFSGDAIKEYIRAARKEPARHQQARSVPAGCPVSGCSAMITEDDLKRDLSAQKQADLAKRRADRREEEMNDDAELVE